MLTHFAVQPECFSEKCVIEKPWEHRAFIKNIKQFWESSGALYASEKSLERIKKFSGECTYATDIQKLLERGLICQAEEDWDGRLTGPGERPSPKGLEVATAYEDWLIVHQPQHLILGSTQTTKEVVTDDSKYIFCRNALFNMWETQEARNEMHGSVMHQDSQSIPNGSSSLEKPWDERVSRYIQATSKTPEATNQIVIYDAYAFNDLHKSCYLEPSHKPPILEIGRRIKIEAKQKKVLTLISSDKLNNDETLNQDTFLRLCDFLWGQISSGKIERLEVWCIPYDRIRRIGHDRHIRIGERHVFDVGPGIQSLGLGNEAPFYQYTTFALKTGSQVKGYTAKEQAAKDNTSDYFHFKKSK
jgi:hypothetical protein